MFSKSGHNLASEAPAHLSQVPAVDQRTGPANSTGAGNITLDTDMCDARIRSKNCYKLNHVLTLWRNRSVTNPQKQTKSVRLMAGSRNCPIGLPLLKSKNTFRFVD